MAKYLISVCRNSITGNLEVVEDAIIKGLGAITYEIDNDYDFGSIAVKDLVIELYLGHAQSYPAITIKEI